MEHEFWHARWERQQIGFHQQAINPYLLRFWPTLKTPAASRLFVPLCGKSRDMLWLRQQGHEAVGVELSEIAVEAFFSENGLVPEIDRVGDFKRYRVEGLVLLCGDFFKLDATTLGAIDAVYDRASLIALPPEMRLAYARHLQSLLKRGVKTLLIAFEYPQHQMPGPPFSVQQEEVATLFGGGWDIELLSDEDILVQEPRFRERGVTQLHEKIYLLERL